MEDTILSVHHRDLSALDQRTGPAFIAELLWAEARRIGLPTSNVHVWTRVNVADGGIDASIDPSGISLAGSFLSPGHVGLQIKTGASFVPWQESALKVELFGSKPPTRDSLGDAVRLLLDDDGTYILVCTGIDPVSTRRSEALDLLKSVLEGCGYPAAKVDLWGQNELIGLVSRFPALALRLNGNVSAGFQIRTTWGSQGEMRRPFKAGARQTAFIESLQKELRRGDAAVHVHVRGEAGVGKTRLVFEATAAQDTSPLVIYCPTPRGLLESQVLSEIIKPGSALAAVLVVDECDVGTRAALWNQLSNAGPRVKLVSIFADINERTGTTTTLDGPPLAEDQVIAVLKDYDVPEYQGKRWASFCSGSPRVAHVVGQNLRLNPDDMLREPDTVNVWDRYIVGRDKSESETVRQRRVVLRHIALFKRFGYGSPVIAEARAVAKLVQDANPQITWEAFQEHVKELRDRKVLQGDTTLYITPQLLHIKLWTEWWDNYGASFSYADFEAKLVGGLPEWFREMVRYADESAAALKVVDRLLSEEGPFKDSGFLASEEAARFLLALTDAAPDKVLSYLDRTIGTWSVAELQEFTSARRQVVWALERIVVWRNLFSRGAELLLRLAETENENIANNATGVFASLFSPGHGALSPTEASQEERFPVLSRALTTGSPKQRRVALRGCGVALETVHISRLVGAEHQGLRRAPFLWMPKTWGEIFDAYRRAWRLVADSIERADGVEEQSERLKVLFDKARGIARIESLSEMVLETLAALANKPYCQLHDLLRPIEQVLHFDGADMSPGIRGKWEALRDGLVGEDFHSKLERYVRMNLTSDLFEDGKIVDKVGAAIISLAEDAVCDPTLFDGELARLVTDAIPNVFRFGQEIGARDVADIFMERIIRAFETSREKATPVLLAGYLAGVFARNSDAWERALDRLESSQVVRPWVPELISRSGMSTRAAERVLRLVNDGTVPAATLRMFAYGRSVEGVPDDVFVRWIAALLREGTRPAASAALQLLYYRYRGDMTQLPKNVTLQVLTAPGLLAPGDSSQMDEHEWSEITEEFLTLYPDESDPIANLIIDHFGEDGSLFDSYRGSVHELLSTLAARSPVATWVAIAQRLGPPLDSRAFHLREWLHNGGLTHMPPEDVWRWVENDVEKRAWYAAYFVPATLSRASDKTFNWAREVLVRYGDREDVRSNLSANVSAESYWGPSSVHFGGRKAQWEELRNEETDPNVQRWITEQIARLDARIEWSRIEEEREDR